MATEDMSGRTNLTESAGAGHPAAAPPQCDPRDEIVLHLAPLRAFALSLTRNPATADDLVQDTVVKAWTHIDQFTPGTSLRSWLLTILRNTFYSSLRKQRSQQARSAAQPEPATFEAPAHDGHLAMRDFLRAFDQLTPEHREVLTLIGILGLSYDEAGAAMGVAAGTIKSRVNRARQRLMSLLELEGDDTIMPDPDTTLTGGVPRPVGQGEGR
jgi:RNA polymerase sigma-70 factor (ECF subfamily)